MRSMKVIGIVGLAVGSLCVGTATPGEGVKLDAEIFAAAHKRIGPQAGESRWLDVAWLTDLHEARQRAATEGKPLFLLGAGKASSIGMC